jgi:hypothetical protein
MGCKAGYDGPNMTLSILPLGYQSHAHFLRLVGANVEMLYAL